MKRKSPIPKLADKVTLIEGKKSSARRGDVAEILKIIVNLQVEFLVNDKGGGQGSYEKK